MHYDMTGMGVIIQQSRATRGITQAAFAGKIEVSLRPVIAIEEGKRNLTFEVLYKVILELNNPDDLVFHSDDMSGLCLAHSHPATGTTAALFTDLKRV